MKTINIITTILIAIGAVIEASVGLLNDLGLNQQQITAVRLVGLIVAVILPIINPKKNEKLD